MTRWTKITMLAAALTPLFTGAQLQAQNEDLVVPEEYRAARLPTQSLAGPRFGVTTFSGTVADQRRAAGLEPMMTQFGWQFEKQLVSRNDGSQALMEWVVLMGGLEQSEFNLSVSWIAGYRLSNGMEFGVGPNINFNPDNSEPTRSMIFAGGSTIKVGEFYVPFNIAVGVAQGGPRLNFLTGWVVGS